MSDLAQLQTGASPWLPNSSANQVEMLDYYEIPTSGIFELQGDSYLFVCLMGHLDEAHLWAYARLDPVDVERVSSASEEEIDQFINQILYYSGRDIKIALATDEQGILVAVTINSLKFDGSSDVVAYSLQALRELIKDEERAMSILASNYV